jgi:hypothetical protein
MCMNRESSGHRLTIHVPASGTPRPAMGGGSGPASGPKTLMDDTVAGIVALRDPCGERMKKGEACKQSSP